MITDAYCRQSSWEERMRSEEAPGVLSVPLALQVTDMEAALQQAPTVKREILFPKRELTVECACLRRNQ